MNYRRFTFYLVLIFLTFSVSLYAANTEKAVAVLYPTEGNTVRGTVSFIAESSGVRVIADIQNLTPGKHGFHIHALGDCTDPSGKSAGGHYNPKNVAHGSPNDMTQHVGDLGNIVANSSGRAQIDKVFPFLTLNGDTSVIGHSVIVHAGDDDLTSQPSGAAGPRVACGVIGITR